MRRDVVSLNSPAIGAAGTVIAYGSWGRPLLAFPAERGEATIASGGHSLAAYGAFFSAGISGPARLLRVAAEALALLAASRGWRTLPLWTVAALAGLAASGHAVDVHPAWWGVLLNAVHLVAAGAWAGAILALAGLRPPGGWRGEPAGQLLRRFAPVALTAFLTTVLTGALQALAELGSWAALAATGYGRVLLAKIGVVGLMVPLSLVGWRGGRPRPRIEAGLAAAAAAAAALLAAFPVPPSLAVERAGRAAVQTAAAGLPGPGELTLGGSAGSVLVGLTIVPARPGSNTVRAYLLPAAGAAAASASPANVSTGGITRPMKSCGAGCRTAAVDLRPGDELDVDVLGPSGGRAGFIVPPLPAPPGDALLSRMQAATHALRTYAVSETLSSGAAIVRSDYTAQAPDRSRWAVRGATGAPISETVVIGTDQYTKPNPDAGWQLQRGVPPVAVPAFVWDYFEPLSDVWVTGVDTIGGVATTEISAFGSRQATPIWFTFWVGADGLARRVAMHAPGHFMTDSYAAFDSPQNIVAPVPGS